MQGILHNAGHTFLRALALQLREDFRLWLLYTADTSQSVSLTLRLLCRAPHVLPLHAQSPRCPQQSTWGSADLSPAGWKSLGSYSWGRGGCTSEGAEV